MTTSWFVISLILGTIWVIVFIVGVGFGIFSSDLDKEDRIEFFQYFSAVMAAAAVFVVAHWIVLCLAIPLFICYGLYSGAKLLITKPWKESV